MRSPLPVRARVAIAAIVFAGGCDLLDVQDPDVILDEDLQGPEALGTIYAGALYDLALAWNYAIVSGAVLTDEYVVSGFDLGLRDVDRRNLDEETRFVGALYADVHRARVSLEAAADRIETFAADPADPRLPEVLALSGLMYTSLAETYCDGVPLSSVADDGSLRFGLPQTGTQLLDTALVRLDRALATPGAAAAVGHLARIVRGRVLVGLGRLDEAAAAVGGVPASYRYRVGHSDRGVTNRLYRTQRQEFISVADREGTNGLPFRSQNDPRVPWTRSPAGNVGQDRTTPQYDLLLYSSDSDPITLASGTEARLIEAEAALARSDPAWLAILQNLRTGSGLDFAGVPPIQDAGAPDANLDLLFSERAFWMFATGHRLGDLRRLIRDYGRAADETFPIGVHVGGGVYGSGTHIVVPIEERANPNFGGCLAR